MNKKKAYMDIAIDMFNQLVKETPLFEVNRLSVESFLNVYIEAHYNVINKYGEVSALNKIFLSELKKYYEAILGIENNILELMIKKIISANKDKLFHKDMEECVIIYPSFRHKRSGVFGINHIPIVDIYIIDKDENIQINSDKIDDNLENFSSFLSDSTFEVAREWTKNKKATEDEISDIALEIIAIVTFDNKAAFKKDVITYLATETNNKKLLRFL